MLSTVTALPQELRPGPRAPLNIAGKKVVSFADAFSGNFTVARTALQWTSQGGKDGNYVTQSGNDLVFANIVTGANETFVAAKDIDEAAADYYDYSIQPSGYFPSSCFIG